MSKLRGKNMKQVSVCPKKYCLGQLGLFFFFFLILV